jgi:DNA-binding beta-propeller fold protein YncE
MIARLPRAALCAALLAFALAAPARGAAAPNHPLRFEISSWHPEPFLHPTNLEFLEGPCGIAVDGSGRLYVSNYYHDEIAAFGSAGDYINRALNVEPTDGPCGLAVDPSGRLYVNALHRSALRFTLAHFPPTSSPENGLIAGSAATIDAEHPTGLALDPATGDLYVDDRTYVAEYEPSGTLIRKIGLGNLKDGYGIAVSGFAATEGFLYVPDAASATVKVFDPATSTSAPVAEIDGAGAPQGGFASLDDAAVAVDDSDGHLFVTDNLQSLDTEHPRGALDEFNSEGAFRGQLPAFPALFASLPTGLAIDNSGGATQGDLYLTSGDSEEAKVYAYGPTGPAQTLTAARTGSGEGTVSSEPAGIDCPGACKAEFDAGAEVTLTATPDPHSEFSGWSGACAGTATACTLTMSEARSVGAEFLALPQQSLSLTVAGSGEGTVRSDPAGIECSVGSTGTCTEHFNEGSTVTLTAASAAHTRFKEWVGLPCDESTQSTCQVQMSEGKALEARFEAIPQEALEASVSGEGVLRSQPDGIECPSSCEAQFDEGQTVTIEALPAPRQELDAWGGACAGTAASEPCEVTMDEAKAIAASFAPIPPPTTLTPNPAPLITPSSSPPPVQLSLGRLTVKGTTAKLRLSVSGAGILTAAGKGLRRARAQASAAGPLTLSLSLSAAGRRALKRRGRLTLEVRVLFDPAGGAAPQSATKSLSFELGGRGAR